MTTTTKYTVYTLKENDTLKSIAAELNKTPQEVADFHNIFANASNAIGVLFPKDLKELYLPISINVKELDHLPKVKFDNNVYLLMKPKKDRLVYQIDTKITTKEKVYSLYYQMAIQCVKAEEMNFVFEINKFERDKDEKLDTIFYGLMEKLDQVFYPLQLLVSMEGNLLEIKNHPQILENWTVLKPKVFDEYQGKVVENYVAYFEKNITDKKKFESLLFRDLFLNTYFNSLYGNYTSKYCFEKQYSFPLISKNKNVAYFVQQKIDPYLTEDNKIDISISGISNDKRTQLDFEYNLKDPFFLISGTNNIVEGTIEAKYTLNPENNIIEKAYLVSDLMLEDYKKIAVSLKLITD
jgi:hypothetical protein